jgi:hypothetical protein
MKNDRIFELKTLFDPFSEEWENTNYEEKLKLIQEVIGIDQVTHKDLVLKNYIVNSMYFNSNGEFEQPTVEDTIEANEEDRQPLVSFYNLLLAVGFYLYRSIDKNFEFPVKVEKAMQLFSELEQLKDGRTKKNQLVYKNIFMKSKINSSAIFALYSEGKSDSLKLPARIEKLKNLHASGATPIEILFCHVFKYESIGNPHEIINEAPYAAFALCWNGNELL